MDEKLLEQATILADRNYKIVFSVESTKLGKALFMAKNPELEGCMAQGETLEEAIQSLRDARIDYIYDSLKDGYPIPEPESAMPQPLIKTGSKGILIKNLKVERFVSNDVQSQSIASEIHQYS